MRSRKNKASIVGWRPFWRGESGATVIEFALLAPIFFALLGATLETSVVFLSSQILESAVQDAGRSIRTGQAQKRGDNIEKFRAAVCDRTVGLLDCSQLHIEVKTVENFASATVTAPVDWSCTKNCGWTRPETYAAGQGFNFMLVQVYYKFPLVLTGGIAGYNPANLPDGKRLIGTATVFRNEPFT